MAVDVFAVPGECLSMICRGNGGSNGFQVFFVVFRESLEVVVVVSVLFAFLQQTLNQPGQDSLVFKRLMKQVSSIHPC